MEAFFLFVLLVLTAVILGKVGSLSRELEQTRQTVHDLVRALRQTPKEKDGDAPGSVAQHVPEARQAPPPIATPPPLPVPEPPVEETAITPERMREVFPEKAPVVSRPVPSPRPLPPPPPPRPSFFERHPDLERLIGENLINKVGIGVLVIGIGLLLRYSVDRGLIGETGQALIGLAAGGVLVFFAHRLRNSFRAFSSVLVAGGIAVFYATIAFAFHQYKLIGQTPAFAVMVLITGLAVALTLAYDRRELAVIALLGGFASPVLASTGEGNFRVLFTYLLILDAGMLVLANFKRWRIINILSFGLTTLFFAVWALDDYPGMEPRPVLLAFAFATAFFLVFLLMNLRYNLRHRTAFEPIDHALLLGNTAVYYGLGMHLLGHVTPKVTGLFTVLLGLCNLVLAVYFHRRAGSPRHLRLLLIGLVLTFVSLAAPVQLDGSRITLFWAAEAVLLLWFAQRTGLRLVERGSFAVLALMLVSLLMDLTGIYGWGGPDAMRPLLNKGWTTGMFAVLSLAGITFLLRRFPETHEPIPAFGARVLGRTTAVLGVILLYLVNLLELRFQLARILGIEEVRMASIAFSLLYLLVLERATVRRTTNPLRMAIGVLFVVVAVLCITGFYASSRAALAHWLGNTGGHGFFLLHPLAFALMVMAVVRMAIMARQFIGRGRPGWNAYLWLMCAYLVVLASQELDHAMLLGARPDAGMAAKALSEARRAGYPILWGLGSFLFMWYGMRQRMRMVRVIALCLFALTLLKLFLVDLRALSEGGRVAAFILLGALLLVVSFMYQRLKELLKEDAPDDLPSHGDA